MNFLLDGILILWQLPQWIAGAVFRSGLKWSRIKRFKRCTVYFIPAFHKTGFSFGPLIFISDDPRGRELLRHEYGHSIQSFRMGWFFWIIGIASVLRYRKFVKIEKTLHDPMDISNLWREYHRGFPEGWTNRLTGVKINNWKYI